MSPDDIQSLILAALPDASVEVQDPMRDGQHFSAIVVSEKFKGLPTIKQHRLVNDALKEQIDSGLIHALQLKTYTPDQWQQSVVQLG